MVKRKTRDPMTNTTDYPAVQWAYDFVLPSYNWALQRFDAVQGRIQATVTVSIALMGAIPAFAETPRDFSSHYFVLALAYFVVLLGYTIYARISGSVTLIHPGELYNNFLDLEEWDFKQSMIFYAAENYEANRDGVKRKWALLNCMVILFLLQTGFLLIWLWRA